MPIAVQWWAVWYPGRRTRRRQLHRPADAGVEIREGRARRRPVLQRRALRPAALAVDPRRRWRSIIVYPQLSDIQKAFPNLDPTPARPRHRLSRHAEVPAGRLHRADGRRPDRRQLVDDSHAPQLGRVYLVHDFYRRFIKNGRHREALRDGRPLRHGPACSSVSSALVFVLDSAKDAFDVILQIGAGTGLLYLVRWFWWRVNAWCEVVAMVSSFAISLVLLILAKNGDPLQHPRRPADHHRVHDGLLGGDRVRRPDDRPPGR